jgi:hypothetical protein
MYVLDRERQNQVLAGLVLQEEGNTGWTQYFADPATGETWKLYYPQSQMHGGGPRVLRKECLPMDPGKLLVRCVVDGNRDDVLGAAYDLSSEPETWDEVIALLERERTAAPVEHVELFLRNLGVLGTVNVRPVVGKSVSEIERDASHFASLSERAAKLLRSDASSN